MLMVLEMAPEMKGWLAAIMRMWLSTDSERLPLRPQGLAQSNTGRCFSAMCGAPSSVMAPHTCSLAASMSFFVNPRCSSRSKAGLASVSAGIFSVWVRNSSPSVQRLKTNLMSKAALRAPSSLRRTASVNPLAFSVEWLMAGACASVP